MPKMKDVLRTIYFSNLKPKNQNINTRNQMSQKCLGIHEDANIAFQLNETNALLAKILDVQLRIIAADGGMSK
nr:hypothetical protein BgiMline_034133 [Biomphalaria glabrata]